MTGRPWVIGRGLIEFELTANCHIELNPTSEYQATSTYSNFGEGSEAGFSLTLEADGIEYTKSGVCAGSTGSAKARIVT